VRVALACAKTHHMMLRRTVTVLGTFTVVSQALQHFADDKLDHSGQEDVLDEVRSKIKHLKSSVVDERTQQLEGYNRALAEHKVQLSNLTEENTKLESDIEVQYAKRQHFQGRCNELTNQTSELTSKIVDLRSELAIAFSAAGDLVDYANYRLGDYAVEKGDYLVDYDKADKTNPKASLLQASMPMKADEIEQSQQSSALLRSLIASVEGLHDRQSSGNVVLKAAYEAEHVRLVEQVQRAEEKQTYLKPAKAVAIKVTDELEDGLVKLEKVNGKLMSHIAILEEALYGHEPARQLIIGQHKSKNIIAEAEELPPREHGALLQVPHEKELATP